jgi:hypothetical protein
MNKRKIKVTWLRTLRLFGRAFKTKEDLNDVQKKGIRIFERMVSVKDAEIFLSPLSDTIYVEVDDIYLILDNLDMQVINGKFQYDIPYTDKERRKFRNRIFNILESRREELEKKIKTKSNRTLDSIIQEVEEIKNIHNSREQ